MLDKKIDIDDLRVSEKVSPCIFYLTVTAYIKLGAAMAILIDDWSFIFGFLGAVQEVCITMIFPSVFMILTLY